MDSLVGSARSPGDLAYRSPFNGFMNATLPNPYLDAWKKQIHEQAERENQILQASATKDLASIARLLAFRRTYTRKYSYAIPTANAIDVMSRFTPLVELGAGTGYWAWMVRQTAADIVCYDIEPPHSNRPHNSFHGLEDCWTRVNHGEEQVLLLHPERTLFLCWPPPKSPMAYRALRLYRGEYFLYVGALPLANGLKGPMADDSFLAELNSHWYVTESVELPNWELCWDRLWVFKRR